VIDLPEVGKKKKKRGSKRACSWIWGAVNPLVDALTVEKARLVAGDFGFRHHTQRLEHLGPPARYLSPAGQVILDDLTRALADGVAPLVALLGSHAARIAAVESAAGDYHRALLGDGQLDGWVREALTRYRQSNGRPEEPWGAFRPEQLPAIVAQHLVNSAGDLPPNAPDAAFWASLRDVKRAVEVRPSRAQLDLLRANAAAAADEAALLVKALADLRFQICEHYDVPAAPVAGL
jgi:hypothetical protein